MKSTVMTQKSQFLPLRARQLLFFLVIILGMLVLLLGVRRHPLVFRFIGPKNDRLGPVRPDQHPGIVVHAMRQHVSDDDEDKTGDDATSGKHWQKVTLLEIEDKFRPKTLNNCENKCDGNDPGCVAKTLKDYQELIASSRLKFIPLLSQSQYIYPFEKEYLSYPPLHDSKRLPDLTLSTIAMAGLAADDIVQCHVNQVITGRLDLVDGYGTPRTSGGDEVRAWVSSQAPDPLFKATGQVTDLKNGSYQFSIRCLVPGRSQLRIAIAYPREFLRMVVHQSHLGVTRYIVARFRNRSAEEVTVCWSTPNVPGRPCLCNFTSVNQQSFYCGRPLDPRLNCSDWDATSMLNFARPQNCMRAEMELIKNIPGPATKYMIRRNITVETLNDTNQLPILPPPCALMSPSITWDWDVRPRGYWSASKQWISVICQRPKLTTKRVVSCLENSRIWVFGDSNGFRLFQAISTAVGAKVTGDWKVGSKGLHKAKNITIMFRPQENPLYSGKDWKPRPIYGGVAKQIEALPSHGKLIVLLHYYLHLTPAHFSVLHSRLNAAHDAIKSLLLRNPEVVVGLRGPHISTKDWDRNHAIGGDSLGVEYLQLVKDIFHDLRHKVVFLDGWDMTLALENEVFHPITPVPTEMIRALLAFKCN